MTTTVTVSAKARPKRKAQGTDLRKRADNLLAKIEKRKEAIENERHALQSAYIELKRILEALDCGLEDIENGVQYIRDGLDALNQLL